MVDFNDVFAIICTAGRSRWWQSRAEFEKICHLVVREGEMLVGALSYENRCENIAESELASGINDDWTN